MADEEDHNVSDTSRMVGSINDDDSSFRDRFAPGVITRLQYASYLFFGLVICMILKGTAGHIFDHFSVVKEGCEFLQEHTSSKATQELNFACFQNTLVYRISFSFAVFFLIQFISVSDLTCCIDADSRAKMQEGMWCVKTTLLSLLITVSFWIPNDFFATYAWICMFVSAIFLILQIVLIVDFSYEWNEDWGDRSENNTKWSWYLLGIAFLCYAGGLATTIVNYYYFVPEQDCNLNAFLITMVLVGMVVYTTIAIWVPHGSIVPCGIVFAYTSIITFSALHLSDDQRCNRLYTPEDQTGWKIMVFTAIFSGGALAYTVVSSGGTSGRSSLSLQSEDQLAQENPDETGHLSNYCFFHGIMIMGSMYLAMLVTNWSVSGMSESHGHNDGLAVAFWVKNVTVWVTMSAYLWTLCAPYFCCRHRDYGFDIPDGW